MSEKEIFFEKINDFNKKYCSNKNFESQNEDLHRMKQKIILRLIHRGHV